MHNCNVKTTDKFWEVRHHLDTEAERLVPLQQTDIWCKEGHNMMIAIKCRIYKKPLVAILNLL